MNVSNDMGGQKRREIEMRDWLEFAVRMVKAIQKRRLGMRKMKQ